MPKRRSALWAASLAAAHTAASAVPMDALFTRDATCAANFNHCNNANFPSYFCCPAGQKCIALAGNTTLLCCPDGVDCDRIKPLPCDISLQDGQKYPDSVVKTTALGGTLGRCGTQCCPFGYSCQSNECVRDQNQNQVPIQTTTIKPSPSTTGTSTSTGTGPDPTLGNTGAAANSGSASPDQANSTSSGPPIGAIVGGVVGGVFGLLLIALLIFFFVRRRRRQSEMGSPPKLSRSTSSFGNYISNPILSDGTTLRSDFARVPGPREPGDGHEPTSVTGDLLDAVGHTPDEAGGVLAAPPAVMHRQSSVAYGGYGSFEPSAYVDGGGSSGEYGDYAHYYHTYDSTAAGGPGPHLPEPQTPQQHQQHDPRPSSSVSINVFADPNITPDRTPESHADRRYTDMTTFTQMLGSAGLDGVARGESFLPHPHETAMPGQAQGSPSPGRRR